MTLAQLSVLQQEQEEVCLARALFSFSARFFSPFFLSLSGCEVCLVRRATKERERERERERNRRERERKRERICLWCVCVCVTYTLSHTLSLALSLSLSLSLSLTLPLPRSDAHTQIPIYSKCVHTRAFMTHILTHRPVRKWQRRTNQNQMLS